MAIDNIRAARRRYNPDGSLKPNQVCELDNTEIKPGDPYKKASGRNSGGFYLRVRCDTCPTWHPWELSDSLPNRLAEIVHNYEKATEEVSTVEEVEQALDDASEAITEIAEEKREAAQNIEDGFQHETEQSVELNQVADDLDAWANDIETAKTDIPDLPDPEGEDGELTEHQIEDWRFDVGNAVTVMGDSPY